jgi:DNA adenine methylase
MLRQINSVLRYPGGKQRMLVFLKKHIPSSTEIKGRYIEPFVGGGAVFFYVQPVYSILSDANPDLIDIYKGIQHSPEQVWDFYCKFGDTKEDYQHVRDSTVGETLTQRAARMLYLNRTCFKGMWRHNRNGNFNVGYGGQARRWVISADDLRLAGELLQNAKIVCDDFEEVIDSAQSGDFLFLDPPYRPGDREHTNDHYIWQQFGFEEHERLSMILEKVKQCRVTWAMTTSSHPDIVKLFSTNYVQVIPRGTGKLPGITTKDSGEVFISSYQAKGSKRIRKIFSIMRHSNIIRFAL